MNFLIIFFFSNYIFKIEYIRLPDHFPAETLDPLKHYKLHLYKKAILKTHFLTFFKMFFFHETTFIYWFHQIWRKIEYKISSCNKRKKKRDKNPLSWIPTWKSGWFLYTYAFLNFTWRGFFVNIKGLLTHF